MTTLANLLRSPSAGPRRVLAVVADRVGAALRRAQGQSYAERRARLERTGSAGLI